jgi:hypothetical protein
MSDNQIQQSAELLRSIWAKRVAAAKEQGLTHRDMYSAGVVLGRSGHMHMPVTVQGEYVYDLTIKPGEPNTVYEITPDNPTGTVVTS